MAQQKKGCGLLITALILLLLGGGIAAYLGMGAVNSGKEFVDSINKGEALVTPETLTYSAKEDGEVTVWITGQQTEDYSKIEIDITDQSNGETQKANKPSASSHMGDQHLIGSFSVKDGKTYQVKVVGAEEGRTVRIAPISSSAVISIIGKGFAAIAVVGAAGFIALILGIIGLVKYLGSKKADAPAPAATPPAV